MMKYALEQPVKPDKKGLDINMENKLISVIGGDLRQIYFIRQLVSDGYIVKTYGFEKYGEYKIDCEKSAAECLKDADVVILPLPSTTDGENINAPLCAETIPLSVLTAVRKNSLLLGGKLNSYIYKTAKENAFKAIDYIDREELAVLNAVPTAEGAIQIAMEELPITLFGSKCVITGYGRIGKILAGRLKGLGAEVTVFARKYSDFAWARSNGYKVGKYQSLREELKRADCVFNTVPQLLFDESALKEASAETLFIDLASKPGGIDFEAASRLGIRAIWALSLPGKVAPHTSGDIIKETVLNIMQEEGIING